LGLVRERKALFPDTDQNVQVFVVMAGEEVRKETIEVLQMLRGAGVRADRDLKERPLRKQMEYASSKKGANSCDCWSKRDQGKVGSG
jgi:histidyl-tRNA synthetase